jgi:hypothetical protein
MRTRLRLATLVALASALIPFAVPAHAQKPALTENIDEKGRVPYHDFEIGSATLCDVLCTISFRPVPAGFRLVITHASGMFLIGSGQSYTFAAVLGPGANFGAFLPTPTSAGNSTYVFSSPLTFYVEPNQVPQILIGNTSTQPNPPQASISGYLVSIP